MLALFLPTVLRGAGLRVVEHADWRTRHHGELAGIRGLLLHHTGTTAASAVDVVYRGRAGLAGPLAQLAVDRDGTWHVISAGQAWHAGTGGPLLDVPRGQGNAWMLGIEGVSAGNTGGGVGAGGGAPLLDVPRDQGNAWMLGIEGVSAGTTAGDWTAAQLVSYPLGVAALCRHLRLGVDRVWLHKTWAPSRKVDIAGWPGDLGGFRAAVSRNLTAPTEDDVSFKDEYIDFAGNRISYEKQLDWTAKRVDQLASDAQKSAVKRADLGYAQRMIQQDIAALAGVVTELAGEIAEIKALVTAPKEQA